MIIDMPEDSTLESTAALTREIGDSLRTVPEVTDYEMYIGTSAPYNFNGLVRHYFLRRSPDKADIQVNLVPKDQRKAQSHDIAKRVRPVIDRIAAPYKARVKARKYRRVRRSCRRWSPKFTVRIMRARSRSPARSGIFSKRPKEW